MPVDTQGRFVLSPVSLASSDRGGVPVELNDRHLRSHRKIRDREQSNEMMVDEVEGRINYRLIEIKIE